MSTPVISQSPTKSRAARALARAARDRRILTGAAATAGAAVAAGVARELFAGDGEGRGDPSDAYRIGRGEAAATALVRIAGSRLDHALAQLNDDLGKDGPKAIHEARKDLKKTRAVLRLARENLGQDRFRIANGRLREASQALAASRDATVKAETLEALRKRYGDEVPSGIAALTKSLDEERRSMGGGDGAGGLEAPARAAAELIEQARRDVDSWSFSKSGFKLIAPGLERSYKRGYNRFADVRDDPTPENVHEWRKRVKDLWYDFRLMRETWPPVLGEMADQAHELADLLGDHHDLTVLSEALDARSGPGGEDVVAVQSLIEGRQEELLEAAVPIGERLYAESPDAFVARLRAYWRARNHS